MPISGEVYDVDDATLAALDILEGISTGYYKRVEIPVVCNGSTLQCYVYMQIVEGTFDPLLELEYQASYTKEAAVGYHPRTELPNMDMMTLIYDLNEDERRYKSNSTKGRPFLMRTTMEKSNSTHSSKI